MLNVGKMETHAGTEEPQAGEGAVAPWYECCRMLPLALALGLECWLGLTDRVTNERTRIMGMVACALAICVLGSEQVSSGVGEEVETVELPEPLPAPYDPQGAAEDSSWWQPSAPSWSLWPVAAEQLSEQGAHTEPPPISTKATLSSAHTGPLTWILHRAGVAAARLRRGALSVWHFTQRCGVPTTVTWEHLVLLGLGLSVYAAVLVARRRAPLRLREALGEIEQLHLEIRDVAEQLNHQNRYEAPSPETLRRRRAATATSGVRSDENTPRRMDLDQLLNAAEEPQLTWPFSSQEMRGRLTDAARKYRKVDATLKKICRQLGSFDSIGLDSWWGRTKRYEVATDCALACADARASSLTRHSVDQLQALLKQRDGGWMARLDSDGDGVLTDRETHTGYASQLRSPEHRRWQPPGLVDDYVNLQHERRGIRQVVRRCTSFCTWRQPLTEEGQPCQDWLVGVVWILLVLLTPDQEFVHAENLCKRLAQQYQVPAAWFRRLVDIRKEQMEAQAQQQHQWTRRLNRRVGGIGYFLLGFMLLVVTDVVPPSSLLAVANVIAKGFRHQIFRLLVVAKSLTVVSVLLLLVEALHWLGLFADRAPGSNWRHEKRTAFRSWWDPPRPAFRVEEEPLTEDDEIAPQMDHAGRVLYKRYAIPTHPDWHRCVPADGSATFYVKESTGQLEWVLPTLDDDDGGGAGGAGSPADGGPPPSAAWNMHTELSRSRHRGSWQKWLEATETAGANLSSAEAAQLNVLPPSPSQLAEAEERARQRSLSSTGADGLPGGEPRCMRPNLVVSRLRLSNWERIRNVVSPHEGRADEAVLSADELERQWILELAREARKAAELADRPPPRPSNPKWVEPTGGRSLEEEEREGLKAWRESQSRFGNARGKRTGVGKSLDELPPPPWMMEKEEIEFRLAIERKRDELNMKLATEHVELAKKRKEEREREARGAAGGLLSPVRALLTPSKSS